MKSIWLTICVLAAAALLCLTRANSNEPDKTPSPAAAPTIGKEAGEVRDDNGLKMKLIWCPPGEFTMGSPPMTVSLTKGYWLGKYEVTQSEWVQLMNTEPWNIQPLTKAKEGEDYPATHISRDDALQFCRKLTEQERKAGRLPTRWKYTLPTEAQWEQACRARTETRFSFGDDESKLGEYAWFRDNSLLANERYAHRVGQKKANPWGLHDMYGNVMEWCHDVYAEELPGGRDPEVKQDEQSMTTFPVSRGGSWFLGAASCRSGRARNETDFRFETFGFRTALTAVEPVR